MTQFLPNGIGLGFLNDRMAVAVVESELLLEESKELLLRAIASRERSELIREKHYYGNAGKICS